jgi:carboxypeptidase C (cathepsin A)
MENEMFTRPSVTVGAVLALALVTGAAAADKPADKPKDEPAKAAYFKPDEQTSDGTVTVGGKRLDYQAVAGTLVVHPEGWDDAPSLTDADAKEAGDDKNPTAEAAMFYVAYFRKDPKAGPRPITFLYNGGPGSASVWLHMGAFGPKRVVTTDAAHSPAAPYSLVNNDSSLLDASDLVFIDAPGTGFGRIAGKNKEKAFFGVDQDAFAFAEFVQQFLTKYGRWNSPKYLFGESYGTTRSAALIKKLEVDRNIDFNGVILLSQCLNFSLGPDDPDNNPGVDLPYLLALPTYAATAWYHHKLPGTQPDLPALIDAVEHFAMTDYARALAQGNTLPATERDAIAERLHQYTGLPVAYILKADLRIGGGEFEKNLQDDADLTTGRLDTRFSGPSLDPLSKEAGYDPQDAAISSAFVSVFNDYVRKDLKYGEDKLYKPGVDIEKIWDFLHQIPGADIKLPQAVNVMPDLANAMKFNPNLKVQLDTGYFDLATPFYEGVYEMQHLPIPASLTGNIEFKFYPSGHMIYANEAQLKALHDNVAGFIRRTDNLPAE